MIKRVQRNFRGKESSAKEPRHTTREGSNQNKMQRGISVMGGICHRALGWKTGFSRSVMGIGVPV